MRRQLAIAVGMVGVLPADAFAQASPEVSNAVFDWRELPAPGGPDSLVGAFVGVSGDALIFAGGQFRVEGNFSDHIYVLTDPAGPWELLDARLSRPLAGGVSMTWDDRLVCVGGEDRQGPLPDAFTLQLRNGRLLRTDLPPLPGARAHLCGAVLGDTLYVAGADTRTFWALDLSTDDGARRWRQLDPWPGPPRSPAVAAVQDNAFFLFGGKEAHRFRTGRGWERVADLPHALAAPSGPGVALGQSHVLVLGGSRDSDAILAYDTNTDTWRTLGTMPDDICRQMGASAAWWRGRLVLPPPGQSLGRLFWAQVQGPTRSGLRPLDYVSLSGYLLILIGMGIFFSRRERSTDQFFLAGRRVPWWAAGISLFGTQLSAITFMAIPAMVYRTNWVYFLAQLTNILVALTVIHVYLPFYRRLSVTTAYEYLEQRYNVAIRLVGSGAFIFFHLVRMGIILYLPALALSAVTGLNIYLCILVMGVLATFYTVLGGIEAVIWSDVLQAVLLLGGALLSFVIISWRVPDGIAGVVSLAAAEGKLRIVNLDWDITTAAVWVIVIGGYMNSLGVYSSDQTVVQRYLTTRDEWAAARSIWTHISIAIPSATLFFALGTALWAFFKTHPELLDPTGKTDQIFPWFIAGQLPAGVSGLVIAALFAAAMSSLDSSMNSMATAITTDFYGRFRPRITDRHRLRVARVLTAMLGVSGTGVALYTARLGSTSIWDLNFEIAGLFGAGLAGLFAAGVLTRRTSGAGILVGFLASGVVLYFVKYSTDIHFFLYGAAGILSCVLIGWLASWILPGHRKDLGGLTIYTMLSPPPNVDRET